MLYIHRNNHLYFLHYIFSVISSRPKHVATPAFPRAPSGRLSRIRRIVLTSFSRVVGCSFNFHDIILIQTANLDNRAGWILGDCLFSTRKTRHNCSVRSIAFVKAPSVPTRVVTLPLCWVKFQRMVSTLIPSLRNRGLIRRRLLRPSIRSS